MPAPRPFQAQDTRGLPPKSHNVKRRVAGLILLASVPFVGPGTAAPRLEVECLGDLPTIVGTPEDDVLRGSSGRDVISGLGGDDIIIGRSGGDSLCGGAGNDVVNGGGGRDAIVLGSGRDRGHGAGGSDWVGEVSQGSSGFLVFRAEMQDASSDVLDGGPGHDLLAPEGGDDVVSGGRDLDAVDLLWVFDPVVVDLEQGFTMSGNGGTEELRSIEGAVGGMYDDALLGDDSTNWLWGLRGADHVDARGGSDLLWASIDGARLVGGNDQSRDTVAVALSEPMSIDLAAGTISSMAVDHAHPPDVLSGIENAVGTDHDDVILGGPLDNGLFGRAGNDQINGGPGDDWLRGDGPVVVPMSRPWDTGAGADSLDGGPGNDDLDGGPKDDSCINGESLTSCESEEPGRDRSEDKLRDVDVRWFGSGGAPWWWSRVGQLAFHPHQGV